MHFGDGGTPSVGFIAWTLKFAGQCQQFGRIPLETKAGHSEEGQHRSCDCPGVPGGTEDEELTDVDNYELKSDWEDVKSECDEV